jgi:ABC-type multidrug transport system fused ATPase/permease subunit
MTTSSVSQSGSTMRRGLAILVVGVRHEPWVFAVAVGGAAVYGTMTVAQAWVLGRVTDRVIVPAFASGRTATGALVTAVAAILVVALLKAVGIVARRLGAGVMQYRLQARYRRDVTRQYLRLPLSWHQRHPTGQLLSNANADVEAIWFPIAPLPMALGVLIMLVVAAVAMLLTDVVLALVAFLVFPAVFVLNVVYQRRLSPLATRAQQLRAEVSGVAHESFDGALVIKTLGREAQETERFGEVAGDLRDALVAVGRVRGMFDPVLEAIPALGVLAVLLLGVGRIESGAIATGDLIQVAYLFTILSFPVRAIGWVLGELPRSVVGWDRVSRVLSARGELRYGAATLPETPPAAALDVRGLRFAYDSGGPEAAEGSSDEGADVLREVSFPVSAGSTVAVVGPTGSGKSTLSTLLVRLVDPRSGAVLIDGINLKSVARGGVAGAASLVPQHTFLFDDTVRGNVTLGLDVEDAQVWAALELAQAHRFVSALPDGLDTRVGERGTTLSGGQRQRLALARAVVRSPRLLVLDDATSSVDPRVEAAILAGLRRHSEGPLSTTVLIVASRRATISLADEVVYVERGEVVDRAPHDELIRRCRGYHSLVTAYEREEAGRDGALEGDR